MTLKKRIAAFAATALMAISADVVTVPASAAYFIPDNDSVSSGYESVTVYGDYMTKQNAAFNSIRQSNNNVVFNFRVGNQMYTSYDIYVYTPFGEQLLTTVYRDAKATSTSASMNATVSRYILSKALVQIRQDYNKSTNAKYTARVNSNADLMLATKNRNGYLGFRLQPVTFYDVGSNKAGTVKGCAEYCVGYSDTIIAEFNHATVTVATNTLDNMMHVTKAGYNAVVKQNGFVETPTQEEAYYWWFWKSGFKYYMA